MVYGSVYAIFTGIHYAAGGDPIYPPLDYANAPGTAALFLVTLIFVVAPLTHALIYLLILARETVWKRYGCCCWSASLNDASVRVDGDVERGVDNEAMELEDPVRA